MARDAKIAARLQRWAQWVTAGDGNGYAAMCVLHEDWMPPAPGTTPTLKIGTSTDARETHRAIDVIRRTHSLRLSNTIVVHYCLKLPVRDQAERLACTERAIELRIERAHNLLAQILAEGF